MMSTVFKTESLNTSLYLRKRLLHLIHNSKTECACLCELHVL